MRVALLSAALLAACAPDGAADEGLGLGDRIRGDERVGGEVVSTVDGHAITLEEVEAAARAAEVEPAVALRRLQDEALLALAARRARGPRDDPAVTRAERQAMVQALLERTVEAEEPEVPEDEVVAAYEASRGRFSAPETRWSAYVVALDAPVADMDAGRAWIAQIVEELREAPDPVNAALAVRRRSDLDALPFAVEVQEVAGLPRDDPRSEPAYLQALFAMEEPGVFPEPVRTQLGWHAVILTRIEPPRTTSREEALETLRQERVAQLRHGELNELVADIARRTPVTLVPQAPQLLTNPRITADR